MINIKVTKWMVIDGKGNFLSNNGFRKLGSPTACPKLFTSELVAKKYMSKYRYILLEGLDFIEVEVNING